MTYLTCDVLLFVDALGNCRITCMAYYKVDPATYLTSSTLGWDAMLLRTNIDPEHISDVNKLSMLANKPTSGLRYVGSKRHVKAHNTYIEAKTQRKIRISWFGGTLLASTARK